MLGGGRGAESRRTDWRKPRGGKSMRGGGGLDLPRKKMKIYVSVRECISSHFEAYFSIFYNLNFK